MQLLHLFLLAEVQLAIPNVYSSPLMDFHLAKPGHTLGQTVYYHPMPVAIYRPEDVATYLSRSRSTVLSRLPALWLAKSAEL